MSAKVNPRTLRVREALTDAAFELVSESPVNQITLTQIAERAGVSRPTVYKQFNDTATLVAEVTIQSLDDTLERIDHEIGSQNDLDYFHELMDKFVQAVYRHRSFYRNAAYGPSAAQILIGVSKMLDQRMSTRHIEKRLSGVHANANDCRAAISAGLVWLLVRWLESDFKGENTPEAIAKRVADTMYVLSGAQEEGSWKDSDAN